MQFNEFDLEKGVARKLAGYAPHFADKKSEAYGYAKKAKENGGKLNVLHVLLRVKNPYDFTYFGQISEEEYTKIVGHPPTDKFSLIRRGYALPDALKQIATDLGLNAPTNEDGWTEAKRRKVWTVFYKRLISLGYDAMVDLNTKGDHSKGYYGKYVVFDPKNVRSIKQKVNQEILWISWQYPYHFFLFLFF